jgi:hypothetical protein
MEIKEKWPYLIGPIVFALVVTFVPESSPYKEGDPWPTHPDEIEVTFRRQAPSRVSSAPRFRRTSIMEDPWKHDARWNTIEWQDFLEELDDKGISLSDPDAQDIWEGDYD